MQTIYYCTITYSVLQSCFFFTFLFFMVHISFTVCVCVFLCCLYGAINDNNTGNQRTHGITSKLRTVTVTLRLQVVTLFHYTERKPCFALETRHTEKKSQRQRLHHTAPINQDTACTASDVRTTIRRSSPTSARPLAVVSVAESRLTTSAALNYTVTRQLCDDNFFPTHSSFNSYPKHIQCHAL